MNVNFVITVRHVFVVFGNVRNPECGMRNSQPFSFRYLWKIISFHIYNIFCISFFKSSNIKQEVSEVSLACSRH